MCESDARTEDTAAVDRDVVTVATLARRLSGVYSTDKDRYTHRHRNDISVGVAKIGAKQTRQSNSKHNFMQYVFLKKAGEFLRIFVLKVTLESVR